MHFHEKIQRSIFFRLLLILLVASISILFVLGAFWRHIIGSGRNLHFAKNLYYYHNFLIDEIGYPPQKEIALNLRNKLGIEIIILKSDSYFDLKSNENPFKQNLYLKTLDKVSIATAIKIKKSMNNNLKNTALEVNNSELLKNSHSMMGWYHGTFGISIQKGKYQYFFFSQYSRQPEIYDIRFLFLILILLLILFITYLSVRRLLHPIRDISVGTIAISRGDFNHRIATHRKDELGLLANSFNHMSEKIHHMIKAKHTLLIDVSHEMRTPLTRIKLSLDMIQTNQKDSSSLKNLKSIKEDIHELEYMIDEILDSERIGSDKIKLQKVSVSWLKFLNLIIKSLPDSDQKRIKLNSEKVNISTKIDKKYMKRAVNNLLQNALKYSSEVIHITVKNEWTDNKSRIVTEIYDTGSGISEEDLPFIFEPFFRGDKSRFKKTGGYGIGLYLTKKIIEAHEGLISIESKKHLFTLVRVELPDEFN